MQLEATYDHGIIRFTNRVKLKNELLKVIVEVPDSEVEIERNPYNLPEEMLIEARKIQDEYEQIRSAPLASDSELPELTEKQRQRLEAIELREEIRKERGHSA